MNNTQSKLFWVVCAVLSFYLCLFSIQKINFLTADLGRHIANGNLLIHGEEFGVSKTEVLYTNLFSYTHPDFPFINHHWGSGIAAYIIFSALGFEGLSLTYILLLLGAFVVSLYIIRKEADTGSIFLVGLFLAPLIVDRMEVRPEAVSVFFIALFICLLYQFSKDPGTRAKLATGHAAFTYKLLFLLPILQILWANLHIYFIFGPFLIGVFLLEALIRKNFLAAKKLATILGLTSLATLLTPYGLSGVIYPFTIFQNYGYRVVENQSISFLENISFMNPSFLWYKITLTLIILSSLIILWKKRKDFTISLTLISLTFAVLAYLGIRNIGIFALVSLPLLIYNLSLIRKIFFEKERNEIFIFMGGIVTFLILVGTLSHFSPHLAWNRDFGLGVQEHSFNSIEFLKQTGISGPFFNNYDIGGAMIFSLFPKEKVFVDNRPEAYPEEFFTETYIPMQENNDIWKKVDNKEQFNTIYFYRLDMTPWSQNFLISRVNDPAWAPVYVDEGTIIFLKRNEKNKGVIEKYELPRSMFGN